MGVEVRYKNTRNTTVSPRVKIPSTLQTPVPTASKNSKPHPPTPIVAYEEDWYTQTSVEADPIYRRITSYNTRHQI